MIDRSIKKWGFATALAGVGLLGSTCSVIPFLAGHALHSEFNSIGKYLVYLSMVIWVAFLWLAANTFIVWYSANRRKRN